MAAPPEAGDLKARAAREDAKRRRDLSVRVGSVGVVLLFVGAIGTVLWTEHVAILLVVMVAGMLLILAAFLAVRSLPGKGFRILELLRSR